MTQLSQEYPNILHKFIPFAGRLSLIPPAALGTLVYCHNQLLQSVSNHPLQLSGVQDIDKLFFFKDGTTTTIREWMTGQPDFNRSNGIVQLSQNKPNGQAHLVVLTSKANIAEKAIYWSKPVFTNLLWIPLSHRSHHCLRQIRPEL